MKKLLGFLYDHIKEITWIYLAFVIFILLFFFRRGDDFAFHMQRLSAIAEEFKMHGLKAIPVRIYSTTLNGYGYGSPMFYGDIFIYPFAALAALGVSVLTSYKIMHVCILIAAYFSVRAAMKRITENVCGGGGEI